jgi:hypothetical protein
VKFVFLVGAVVWMVIGLAYLIFNDGQLDRIHGMLYIIGAGVAYGLSLLERLLEILDNEN